VIFKLYDSSPKSNCTVKFRTGCAYKHLAHKYAYSAQITNNYERILATVHYHTIFNLEYCNFYDYQLNIYFEILTLTIPVRTA